MTKQLLLVCFAIGIFSFALQAQTVEELKAQKAEKAAALSALQGEVDALTKQILEFPGWKFGALGTIGGNFNKYDNWFGAASPYSGALDIGLTASAFANLDLEKYFFRNALSFNFKKARTVEDSRTDKIIPDGDEEIPTVADNIGLISAYGYKIRPKIAISALADFKTSISNFNDPGYLDIGAGVNWTPLPALTVYFHPLNYQFVFSNDELQSYESNLGCKILAQYAKSLPLGVAWSSTLSGFVSYKETADFSNWEWVNNFGFNIWNGLGVGFSLGLRGDLQQEYNNFLANELDANDMPKFTTETLKIGDVQDTDGFERKLQSYFLVGLTYAL